MRAVECDTETRQFLVQVLGTLAQPCAREHCGVVEDTLQMFLKQGGLQPYSLSSQPSPQGSPRGPHISNSTYSLTPNPP